MSESSKVTKGAGAPTKGSAKVTSFRYYKSLCFVTLSNGVNGIVGASTDFPFAVMLSLKGSGIECVYEYIGKSADEQYNKYKLGWAL